jgi:hypothetical protein
MRPSPKRSAAAAFLLALSGILPAAVSASVLNVQVRNNAGLPVAGAHVVALSFRDGEPSTGATRIYLSDSSGTAKFAGAVSGGLGGELQDNASYIVIATSQSFLPGLADQFNNNPPGVYAVPGTTSTVTIVLSSAGVSGVGEIDVDVNNATPNALVFGQLGLKTGGGAAAYGITNTDGSGAGSFQFYNIAYANSGTYLVSTFDKQKNRAASQSVDYDLNASTPVISKTVFAGFGTLDFNAGVPPVTSVSQTQQSGSAGGLSVDGVVVDTATGNPIPYIHVDIAAHLTDTYGQNQDDFRGTNTDENGRFQFYNLQTKATYYATIYGGCSGGSCFQGQPSTAQAAGFGTAAPGRNDFVYPSSSTVLKPRVGLFPTAASNVVFGVYVKDQFGDDFPQSGVGLFPDGQPWKTPSTGGPFSGCVVTTTTSNPGLASLNDNAATGYIQVSGLPPGNYQVNAWTPFGWANYNDGPDQKHGNGNCGDADSSDNLRVTITTSVPYVSIYDINGNFVTSGSSVTVTVNVSTGSTGMVKGTLTLPSSGLDLSQSPIVMTLYPQCDNNGSPCTGGNFATFNAVSTGPTINYAIPVSSGQVYWMDIRSKFWGAVLSNGGQNQVDLKSTATATVDLSFQPAGRILGSVRKPDGSVYLPPKNQTGGGVRVDAEGQQSYGGAQVSNDGSFIIGGLLPGNYTLRVRNDSGSFPYTVSVPAPVVAVTANKDSSQDANLVDAVSVRPLIDTAKLPPLGIKADCPQGGNNSGECPPETWLTLALPRGTPLDNKVVTGIMADAHSFPGAFAFSQSTGNVDACDGDFLSTSGVCTKSLAANAVNGASFDFYVLRYGGFDSSGYAGYARPNFVIELSSPSVKVQQSLATNFVYNSNFQSTSTVQNVSLVPAAALPSGQATLKGAVTISNLITSQQFAGLGGNFNNFLNYLPMAWVYDSTGALTAAGLAVPNPSTLGASAQKNLDQSVASGDYSSFKTLTNAWSMGYEIRGLTPGATYTLVLRSPNYPPYTTSVRMGVSGSTTTADVDFNLNPGETLSGVVQSTAAVAIKGAHVTLKAPGFAGKTLTTDSNGAFSVSGLGAGSYQVTVVASGYAQGAQSVTVSGSGSASVPAFKLQAADAVITGTVYTNNPVCPAGSTGCAAFGKTVLQGASVLAYDDTLNSSNPTAVLPLYRAYTSTAGYYRLEGLQSGETYKIFVNVSGYLVTNATFTAVVGVSTGADVALKPKPLDVNVYGHPEGDSYEFDITNYKQFSDGKVYIGSATYSSSTAIDVSNQFIESPDASGVTELTMDYPLSLLTPGKTYTLHIEAQPNDPHADKVVKNLPFGRGLPHNACQSVDQALIGDDSGTNAQGQPNNQLPIDNGGGGGANATALSLPAGALIPSVSTAVPSLCMSEIDASTSTQQFLTSAVLTTTAAFASGVYKINLSSVSFTQKGVEITLSYDKANSDVNDLAIYTFDTNTSQWSVVPGVQTIDPVKGTISVKGLKSLSSVLSVSGATGVMAVTDGHSYRPAAATVTSDSGLFSVLKPSLAGGNFTGTSVRIYNFPNPFSLQTKTVALNTGSSNNCSNTTPSMVTDGTVIKYELPALVSGHTTLRIYTLSGRLVRILDLGDSTAGQCYYSKWDGRNRRGQQVADGVYYGILTVGGKGGHNATLKMAVIK